MGALKTFVNLTILEKVFLPTFMENIKKFEFGKSKGLTLSNKRLSY